MDINLDRKEKKAECRVNKTERVRRKEVHACTLWSCNNMYSKCWLCTTCFFGVFFFQKAHAPCEVCFGEQTIHEWRQMTVTFFFSEWLGCDPRSKLWVARCCRCCLLSGICACLYVCERTMRWWWWITMLIFILLPRGQLCVTGQYIAVCACMCSPLVLACVCVCSLETCYQ